MLGGGGVGWERFGVSSLSLRTGLGFARIHLSFSFFFLKVVPGDGVGSACCDSC